MAQPNMVREPSMDEILASIRRIIESNEPVTQAGVATAMGEPEGFMGQAANDDSEEVTLTVDDAFIEAREPAGTVFPSSERFPAAEAQPQARHEPLQSAPVDAATTVAQVKALSLADVAARVRAASERNASTLRDMPAMEPAEEIVPQAAFIAEREEPSMPPAAAVEPMLDMAEEEPVYQEPARSAVDAFVEPVREDMAVAADEAASMPLVSNETGEQVARSFQSLAFAIDQAERRSFDEIAAEMLRPMLQEWLDDNLPTLVERLVREEIERVARGPRR